MSRRRALQSSIGATLLGAGHALAGTDANSGERPNILWLVSEDNNPFIGAYGDTVAHTPHLDAFARAGVRYENVYCGVPVCAPSRFSILTGIPAHSCSPAQHHTANATLPSVFKTYPELLRQAGYYCTNLFKTDYNCNVDPHAIWNVQGPEGHWRNAPRNKPFLCVINTGVTHESQLCAAVDGRVTPQQVRVPAYLPDTPQVRSDIASYYNLMERMDAEIQTHLDDLAAAGLSDNTIVFYYSDNGGILPRSKRFCYEEGQRIALMVRYPARWQHLAQAPAGGVVKAPVTLLDLAPTLLAIAGVSQPAQMVGQALVRSRTLAPNRLAFGSRDRMDERYDFIRTVTDGRWRYIRNYMPHRPWGQHVAFQFSTLASYRSWAAEHMGRHLTPAQDRFWGQKPFEELYDLAHDRDEVHNLASSPQHQTQLATFRKALDAEMLRTNDNGFITEGMKGEGFFESRDRQTYPLPRLMVLAGHAARRNPRNIKRFLALLNHPNPMMRYWASMGLTMLPHAPNSMLEAVRLHVEQEAIPQIRIVLAECLAANGDIAGVDILGSHIATTQPTPVRLQAYNALTYVGSIAEKLLPRFQEDARSANMANLVGQCAQHLVAQLTGQYQPSSEGLTAGQCTVQKAGARRFMG